MMAKKYSEEEIEMLAEKAAENAMEHFKHGLNCGECVLQGFLDLGITDYPHDIVGLVSGFGAGMGATGHTCGAVNAGIVVIGSEKGRKNPYAKPTFEERVDELNHPETGIYARHGDYIRQCFQELGTIECRDLCIAYPSFHSKERARNCKRIIGIAAKLAVRAALKE